MPVDEFSRRTIKLDGRLILAGDPLTNGENFQALTNLRYTDTHKKMVLGMTKINTTIPTTYFKVRDAFHLRKFQPAESHVLVQAYNTGLTAGVILDNTTAIPSAGDFSATALFTETTGHGYGRFSDAPDGHVAYCNGKDACVWAGNEMRVAKFISYTPDLLTVRDFTDQVTNALTDVQNVATLKTETVGSTTSAYMMVGSLRPLKGIKPYIGTANTTTAAAGSVSANVMMLLHGNGVNGGTTITDSSPTTPHTVTANGNLITSTAKKKFGTASLKFDGTGDYASIPDNADFDLSGGSWSIEGWLDLLANPATSMVLYYQYTASDDDSFKISLERPGNKNKITLTIKAAAATVVSVAAFREIKYEWDRFTHFEVTQSGGIYYIFIDGVLAAQVTDPQSPADYAGSVYIGADAAGANGYNGYIDELVVWNAAQHTANFSVRTAEYAATGASVAYWDGASFTAATNVSDGTVSASKTLAVTGTVSFDTTVGLAKPSLFNDVYLFWYKVIFVDVDANVVTLTQVTVDAPFGPIEDLWDAATRQIGAALVQLSTAAVIKDYTTNLFKGEYDSQNEGTYAVIGAITSTGYLIVGFTEQQTAIRVTIVEDKGNAVANTVASVNYWDGNAYQQVDGLVDGTSEGGVTFAKSGTLAWSAPDRVTEFAKDNLNQENSLLPQSRPITDVKTSGAVASITTPSKRLQKDIPAIYFYKITFSTTITATTRLSFLGGIPAQRKINGYAFPVHSGNRLWLFNEKDGQRNKAIPSATYTTSVWNGEDVQDFLFGDDSDLTAGAGLLFTSQNVEQHALIACKANQTFAVVGAGPGDWTFPYLLSPDIGCIAPRTMRVASVPIGAYPGPTQQVAIFVGAKGIYLCNGSVVTPVHHDIRSLFEDGTFTSTQLSASTAFVDDLLGEYHWCVASREFVLDYRRARWYEFVRGAGKELLCGVLVTDTNGLPYTYGFIDTGYMERLENGTTFDGTAIAGVMHLNDLALNDDPMLETVLKKTKLMCKQKSLDGATITGTHYADTSTSGTTFTLSATKAGYRVADPMDQVMYGPAIFHGLKFAVTSDDESVGFEPLLLAVEYDTVGHDVTA